MTATTDLIEFLKGERGTPRMKQIVAAELASHAAMMPGTWTPLTSAEWIDVIDAAIACGSIMESPKGISIPTRKPVAVCRQPSLFE